MLKENDTASSKLLKKNLTGEESLAVKAFKRVINHQKNKSLNLTDWKRASFSGVMNNDRKSVATKQSSKIVAHISLN
jgi:hypothetical protein